MAEEQKALTIKDAESISDAILKLVIKYSGYPASFKASQKTVVWNTVNTTQSIGLFPMQGSAYTRQYLSGNYEASFPFRIVYKSSPTSNPDMMASQKLVEDLAMYLEDCGATFTDEHIQLSNIERTSLVYPYETEETGLTFTCTLTASYFYKK